jgi:hypothetical protein
MFVSMEFWAQRTISPLDGREGWTVVDQHYLEDRQAAQYLQMLVDGEGRSLGTARTYVGRLALYLTWATTNGIEPYAPTLPGGWSTRPRASTGRAGTDVEQPTGRTPAASPSSQMTGTPSCGAGSLSSRAQQPVCRLRPPHRTPRLTSLFSAELKRIDEWVFRFNRRHSRSRGLLFHTLLRQAVDGQPVTYRSLRKAGRTRPAPPPARGAGSPRPAWTWGGPNCLGGSP